MVNKAIQTAGDAALDTSLRLADDYSITGEIPFENAIDSKEFYKDYRSDKVADRRFREKVWKADEGRKNTAEVRENWSMGIGAVKDLFSAGFNIAGMALSYAFQNRLADIQEGATAALERINTLFIQAQERLGGKKMDTDVEIAHINAGVAKHNANKAGDVDLAKYKSKVAAETLRAQFEPHYAGQPAMGLNGSKPT